ncbi:DNA polymerase III subunit delta' [Glacieibacterium sp.]|uniref:DNA polymerase III subunit delta' n=1 Tax=Glacieibacterium sp. TaxID=2860237 RepID=UPI003B00ED26
MLVGHAEQSAAFRDAFVSGNFHHAWLLAGPPGVGKGSFARAAAAWVLARAAGPPVDDSTLDVPSTHPTIPVIAAGGHPDYRVLERTSDDKGKLRTVIRVDEIRALQPLFRNTPALSDWRVVIVDAADDMNRNAANALLKNLEEPPTGTLFLVVSHSPGRLLPTIRSRCRTLRFHPLSETEVSIVLSDVRPELSAGEVAALARVAGGAPGRALQLAEAGVEAMERDLDSLAVARGGDATARALALARSLSLKAAMPRYEAFLDLAPSYLATAARTRTGARLGRALSAWEKANELAASAVPLSLEPQAVSFELAMLVATLAD